MTEDMDNLFLITGLRPVCLSTTVYSAFGTVGLTELPVAHYNVYALGCKRLNGWNVARMFCHYLEQV